jgi:hypothetical protein
MKANLKIHVYPLEQSTGQILYGSRVGGYVVAHGFKTKNAAIKAAKEQKKKMIKNPRKKNPSGDVFCYHCKKPITGKSVRVVPSNLHGQLLGDFGKSFHPACYKKAQDYSRKKNPAKKHNPRKRSITNRWGVVIHVGDSFKVRHPHGETDGPHIVSKLETSGEYAKAYGPRVIFEHGGSASIDDLIVTPQSYKKNPAKKSPGGAFKKGERVKKAQDYSRKKNPIGMYTVGTDLYGRSMLHGWDSEEDAQSAIDDSPLGDGVTMGTTTYHRPATRSDVARLKYDQDGNAVGAEFIGNYRAPVNGPRKKNPSRKKSNTRTVFEKHQLKIARDTLKMHPAGAAVMGGPSHAEARAIIARLTRNGKNHG